MREKNPIRWHNDLAHLEPVFDKFAKKYRHVLDGMAKAWGGKFYAETVLFRMVPEFTINPSLMLSSKSQLKDFVDALQYDMPAVLELMQEVHRLHTSTSQSQRAIRFLRTHPEAMDPDNLDKHMSEKAGVSDASLTKARQQLAATDRKHHEQLMKLLPAKARPRKRKKTS
jgi:hypothetical protein